MLLFLQNPCYYPNIFLPAHAFTYEAAMGTPRVT